MKDYDTLTGVLAFGYILADVVALFAEARPINLPACIFALGFIIRIAS